MIPKENLTNRYPAYPMRMGISIRFAKKLDTADWVTAADTVTSGLTCAPIAFPIVWATLLMIRNAMVLLVAARSIRCPTGVSGEMTASVTGAITRSRGKSTPLHWSNTFHNRRTGTKRSTFPCFVVASNTGITFLPCNVTTDISAAFASA